MLNISDKEREDIISTIKDVLAEEDNIVFTYLYGSFIKKERIIRDIDVAVYCNKVDDPFSFQADRINQIVLNEFYRR